VIKTRWKGSFATEVAASRPANQTSNTGQISEASRDCPGSQRASDRLTGLKNNSALWLRPRAKRVSCLHASYMTAGAAAVGIMGGDCTTAGCRVVICTLAWLGLSCWTFDLVLPHYATSHATHLCLSPASIPGPPSFSKHVFDGVTHRPCAPVATLARTQARGFGVHFLPYAARKSSIPLQSNVRTPVASQVIWPTLTLHPTTNACHGAISLARCDRRVDFCDKPTYPTRNAEEEAVLLWILAALR
jgi:hypothetical protein